MFLCMYGSNAHFPLADTDREGSTDNMSTRTASQPCKQERKGSFFKVCPIQIIIPLCGKEPGEGGVGGGQQTFQLQANPGED